MSNKNNIQAFPLFAYVDKDDHSYESGLSKREYFAAHAPEIPEWFTGKSLDKPKEPKHWEEMPDGSPDKRILMNWHRDPCYDLPDHLKYYQEAWEGHSVMMGEWDRMNVQLRYFQWRVYYADNMLAELEK